MNGGTVFIVDDDPRNLAVLEAILDEAGYTVHAAKSGARALEMIHRSLPELVLLDIQMPELDGYEVCRQLECDDATRHLPVIFISALADVLDKVRAFESGGVDYVTKPFEAAEVVARVESQLRLSRLQGELERRNAELQRMYDEVVRAQHQTGVVFSALSETLIGTVLDGTYRLDAKIGEGGFGAVFRGTHLGLERPVAVKVLRPTAVNESAEALSRFRLEGIASCRLSHPNAVEVIDFAISSTGIPYMVMELLRGYTLAWMLRERGRLTPERSAPIVAAVCSALADAHSAGIVHRDIKPENVFLHQTRRGEVVKVVDFGIAKLMDEGTRVELSELTMSGMLVGTPDYMAPERLLDEPYDGKADVYSCGVMVYRMLSGAFPYRPSSRGFVALACTVLGGLPVPLRAVRPELPVELAEEVMSTLDRDPSRRPTAREMGERFSAAASGAR